MVDRLIMNDTCIRLDIPFVHAGISRLYGQIMTVIPRQTPCLRCLFPETENKNKEEVKGILGAAAGAVGSMQAIAAYKHLLGIDKNSGLVIFDAAHNKMEQLTIDPDPNCFCQSTNNKKGLSPLFYGK